MIKVAIYVTGEQRVKLVNRTQAKRHGVKIKGNEWFFRNAAGEKEGPFEIGATVRVPSSGEDREWWGPMMAFRDDCRRHVETYNHNVNMLREGQLIA
jgi:hypothetical protein